MSGRSWLKGLLASGVKQQNLNVGDSLRSLSWSYGGETNNTSCTRRVSKTILGGTTLARASHRESISSCSASEADDEEEGAGWREEGSKGGEEGCVKAALQSGSHFNTRDSVGEEEGEKEMEERKELWGEPKEEKDIDLLVYAELSSIRDKLKTQLQLVAEKELCVQREAEDLREREVAQKQTEKALNWREEALRAREEALVCREAVTKSREEKLACRESKVIEVERLACEVHRSLTWCMEQERVRVEGERGEEEVGEAAEVARLHSCVRKKCGEVDRLRLLFNGAKLASENLKRELQEAQKKNLKLQSQLSLVRSRLASEQRKNEQLVSKLQQQQQIMSEASEYSFDSLVSTEKNKMGKNCRQTPVDPVYSNVLATVMQWLCRVHLSQALSSAQLTEVQQLSSQVLPSLAFLLPRTVAHSQGLQLPVLELVYWCVAHLSPKQQSALVSTLRRIGETVYKHLASRGDEGDKQKMWSSQAFCTSRDCHSRTLSCLLALQTLTQVDRLAHVFEQLKECLKEELGRNVFLTYHGVQDVLPFMSPANRILCNHAVDTYLLLSTGSTLLPHLLAACFTDRWFTACTALLKHSPHTPNTAILEKISILLQRLSKEKNSRYLFDEHRVVGLLEDLLRSEAGCSSHFLSLNLHSTLINLGHQLPPL